MFISTTEEDNIMEEKEKIFWFHAEDADALDETEVPVYCLGENNLETDAEYGEEMEEDNRYIELPVLGSEELLNVDEPLVLVFDELGEAGFGHDVVVFVGGAVHGLKGDFLSFLPAFIAEEEGGHLVVGVAYG